MTFTFVHLLFVFVVAMAVGWFFGRARLRAQMKTELEKQLLRLNSVIGPNGPVSGDD